MAGRLSDGVYAGIDARLAEADARVAAAYPGEPIGRQPVHTVYVPASRYRARMVADWGKQAVRVFLEDGDLLALDDEVSDRVREKLLTEPIEDLRIDFEDGYGNPGDDVEDAAAVAAGRTLAVTGGTPFVGIRFKSFEQATRRRGIRTLDLFLSGVLETGPLPEGFVVTLPKVTAVEQVEACAEVLEKLEAAYGLAAHALKFEVQIETSQSILATDGTVAVARIIQAAAGRCTGLHYGTYDYSAGLGISAAYQSMEHRAADFAKQFMQVAAAGTGVRLSDGSTNKIPVGDRDAIGAAWSEQTRLVRRSLENGFYQGWDLHPHQLPSRFAATYAFFREGFPAASARLRDYAAKTESGVMDEPATAQALAAYLTRGLDCGALDEAEVLKLSTLDRPALDRLVRRQQP
jgi:citrate lyase beta subunit